MHQITVNGIVVDVVRKNIKNLHLGVYPPNGRVRVAAPLRVSDDAVRLFTISKLGWIKRQQALFEAQERQGEREYITGESHYYQGRRYLLNVEERDGTPEVVIRNNTRMDLFVRPGSDTRQREQVLLTWYRRRIKETVAPLIAKWERALGVSVAAWGIKRMKTKWGTCNREARRIWLNLELIKKPSSCLEYLVVHELNSSTKILRNGRAREGLALPEIYYPPPRFCVELFSPPARTPPQRALRRPHEPGHAALAHLP